MGKDLEAENEILRAAVKSVEIIIANSQGVAGLRLKVAGLHLNDEVVPWLDLLQGGRYEEWLIDYSAAVELLSQEVV